MTMLSSSLDLVSIARVKQVSTVLETCPRHFLSHSEIARVLDVVGLDDVEDQRANEAEHVGAGTDDFDGQVQPVAQWQQQPQVAQPENARQSHGDHLRQKQLLCIRNLIYWYCLGSIGSAQ